MKKYSFLIAFTLGLTLVVYSVSHNMVSNAHVYTLQNSICQNPGTSHIRTQALRNGPMLQKQPKNTDDKPVLSIKCHSKPVPTPKFESADRAPHIRISYNSKAQGDSVWGFDVNPQTGDNQNLGVEFAEDKFFITGGNTGSDTNNVYVLDHNGILITSFQQFRSSGWGWRDIAWDGNYLYASDDNYVTEFGTDGTDYGDFPGPLAPNRALAYDPATDHFWTANWDSDIYEFTRTGAVVSTYPNTFSVYGMAWDDISLGGPFLWILSQDGSDPYCQVSQFAPSTGTYTGVSYQLPGAVAGDVAGGCCFTTEWDPSIGILFGLIQGGPPDKVVGMEICLLGDSTDPLPPTNVTSYSDYNTPTSIALTWLDPIHYVNGDTLINFYIHIYHADTSLIDSVAPGIQNYNVTGLTDGTLYTFLLRAIDLPACSTSVLVSSPPWYAGGSPYPAPPSSLSAVADTGTSSITLTWNDPTTQEDGTPLDDLAGIKIYYSDSTLIDSVSPGIQTYTDTGLAPAYYEYLVTAYDNEVPQNQSKPSNLASAGIYTYYQDFEISHGQYEPSPDTGAWEWGIPTYGPDSAHSGTKVWATLLSSNYANYANWKLVSRNMIATDSAPVIAFWHWYDIEDYYDGGNVKISINFGPWTLITPQDGYPEPSVSSGNAGIPNEPAFSSSQTNWKQEIFYLSCTVGDTIKFMWHFGTDISVTYPGWYIDDVIGYGFVPLIFDHDVATVSIDYPGMTVPPETTITPQVTVANLGMNTESFDVTMQIDSSGNPIYTNTQTITNLAPNSSQQISFADFTVGNYGTEYFLYCYTQLASDEFLKNDTLYLQITAFEVYNTIPSQFAHSVPTFNGIIDSAEWADAFKFDISDIYGNAGTGIAPPKSAYMYVKNDSFNIYFAVDAMFDATPTNYDQIGLYFDDTHNRAWEPFPDSTEGNDNIGPQGGVEWYSRWICAGPTYGDWQSRTGFSANHSISSGHMEYEAAVPFGTQVDPAYVNTNPGDTVGFFAFASDAETGAMWGWWPQPLPDTGWNDPAQYGDLILSPEPATEEVSQSFRFALYQNVPNPIRNKAVIFYEVPAKTNVTLKVYNAAGMLVKALVNGVKKPGYYKVMWDGKDAHGKKVARGIYFYRLEASEKNATKKLILLR